MLNPLRTVANNLCGPASLVVFDLISLSATPLHEALIAVSAHLPIRKVRECCVSLQEIGLVKRVSNEHWEVDHVSSLSIIEAMVAEMHASPKISKNAQQGENIWEKAT